jgi:hypothetical protein
MRIVFRRPNFQNFGPWVCRIEDRIGNNGDLSLK